MDDQPPGQPAPTTSPKATDAAGTPLPANSVDINRLLAAAGVAGRVRLLPAAVPTAAAAAELLGCPVGAIANSLIFMTEDGTPLLVLTSGAHRVDTDRVARLIGVNALRRAKPDFVRAVTGQVIGGVSPIGHPAPIRTLIDVALAEFDQLWAAGGVAHSIFPINYEELRRVTRAEPAIVASET